MFIVAFDTSGRLIYVRRLTRRHYYHAAKIDAHNKRVLKWSKSLQGLYSSLSEYHFKTSNPVEYLQSIQNYATHYNAIWRRMGGSKKWRRGKFYLYKQKIKTIDDFLHSLKIKYRSTSTAKKGKKKNKTRGSKTYCYNNYVMLYGSGNFPSGAKGERYVPLKYIKKRCGHHFNCHEVNEFRTSQVCPHCEGCRLSDVVKVNPGMVTETKIRGMKWCPSEECKHNPLKNRDMVGSINIMKRGLNVEHPNPLFDRKKVYWKRRSPNVHKMYYPPKMILKPKEK